MGSFVGPIQPMVGGMPQENFGQMVNHVSSFLEKLPPQIIKRRLNFHFRNLQDIRMWAGLMVRGEIRVPDAYSTGTVDVVAESSIVAGTSTAWPYNDSVNTTLSAAVTAANEIQYITPSSMAGISSGDYLLFDEGEADEEYVLVHALTSTSFQARPTKTHLASATVTKSSFSGRQIKVGTGNSSLYTIIGIDGSQNLTLDHPYSYDSATAQTYQILKAYVTMPIGFRFIWSILNIENGWPITSNINQHAINRVDALRKNQGLPYKLVDFIPDAIGRIRYELWPHPTSAQGIPYLAARTVADLDDDEDTPPPCIPSALLVSNALADLYLYKRSSEWYDPRASVEHRKLGESQLLSAVNADDNIYMQNLRWIETQYFQTRPGADFWQSHDEAQFYDDF